MKQFIGTLICFSMSLFCSKIGNADEPIVGLWLFEVGEVKNICRFLKIPKQNTAYYCLKIVNNREGYIYFTTLDSPIKVEIGKYDKDQYWLSYKNRKRDYRIRFGNILYWHYDDSCKYQPKNEYYDCYDGYLVSKENSEKSLKRILDWIKKEDSLPDAPPPF